ncbi:sensor domain-containing protein [Propylenella binzhouense]|nr:EAL domain-containing protein [Propylenella binzhouense]
MIDCPTDMSAQRDAAQCDAAQCDAAQCDTEERLKASERRYRSLVAAMSSVVFTAESEGIAAEPLPYWEEFTGQTFEQMAGSGWMEAVHPEDRAVAQENWRRAVARGEPCRFECRIRRKDGVYRWFGVSAVPVVDNNRRLVEWVGTLTEIHAQRAAEQELECRNYELRERMKELRCLHAIAMACNQDDTSLPVFLDWITLVLPSAMRFPEDAVCRVVCDGAAYLSGSFSEPAQPISAAIVAGGSTVGSVEVGYRSADTGAAEPLPEERDLVATVAMLIGQAISRQRDRQMLEMQSRELTRRQTLFEQMARLAKVGGWEVDLRTRELRWTDQTFEITEWPRDRPPDLEWQLSRYEGEGGELIRSKFREIVENDGTYDLELPYVTATGRRRWLRTIGQVERVDGEPRRAFGALTDVTDAKLARNRMWELANRDSLTGLPNRRLFQERLEDAVSADVPTDSTALLLLDLDDFKDVNDTLGHDAGDALLKAVAERLEAAVGETGMVARLGGDEFAILVQPIGGAEEAHALASRLAAEIVRPIAFSGESIAVRATIGIALHPYHAGSAAELFTNADVALYVGKRGGAGRAVVFKPAMRHVTEERVAVCASIRRSLERDEILPFYQPKICLATNRVTGLEALVRRRHPEFGVQPPAAFAIAFQNTEIAGRLGERMLDLCLRDMADWAEQGVAFGQVALNLSEAEFRRPDLVEVLLDRIARFDLAPAQLGVEVTETVLLGREGDAVGARLQELHRAGISIALDDFGTGYASLTHLRQFPVDTLKIDRSFIQSIEEDAASRAIALAVVTLGHTLGMDIVAEGVETPGQADLLAEAGCDVGQGYLFAKPMPATRVPHFIRTWGREDGAPESGRRPVRLFG